MGQKRPLPGSRENAAERRIKALELRKAGATYRAIGTQLKVSEAQAFKDVNHALEQLVQLEKSSADELRQLELERLDQAQLAIAQLVRKGNLNAIDRMLRIMERRSKLLGLDAAIRTTAEISGVDGKAIELSQVDYSKMSEEELMILYRESIKSN